MTLRGHEPIELTKFNGLWNRGDTENTPTDHFYDCENVISKGTQSFGTRDGVGLHQNVAVPLGNVVRLYNYITGDKNTLIVLTYDGTTGNVYHVVDSTTVFGPILTKVGMSDIAFVAYAGRAYISPFTTFVTGGINIEKGLQSEFLYVYAGTGTAARKAGGATPAGTLTVANGAAGFTDAGFHLFAVVGETDSGFLSGPVAFKDFTTSASSSVSFSTIPTFSGSQWIKRHIVATIKITDYNGNTTGYRYFFIPNATINDNVTTTLPNISFFDADLLEDASHLLDNYAEIPAGAVLSLYHNRLVLATTYTDISLALISAVGEPEAISQIDGLLTVKLDGNPITNAQELRDILYLTKRSRTVGYVDNEDAPSSWKPTTVDDALGAAVHSIGTVIDQGSGNVDFLIIVNIAGIFIFNGIFQRPELSWKLGGAKGYWNQLNKSDMRYVQVINDPIKQIIYITLPNRKMIEGHYENGMDAKNIKWWPVKYSFKINTIALVNINDLIIGSEGTLT